MGVGGTKADTNFTAAKGLASSAAQAIGGIANDDLTEVFRLSSVDGDNRFNVSVNGINGVVEVPSGFYVGSTLAEALKSGSTRLWIQIQGRPLVVLLCAIPARTIILSSQLGQRAAI